MKLLMTKRSFSKSQIARLLDLVCIVFGLITVSPYFEQAFLAKNIWPYLEDDASYYAKIAYFFSQARGYTFDGLHFTNGFHPLLAWILAPFFWLYRDPAFIGTILITICSISYIASCLLIHRFTRRLMPGSFWGTAIVLSFLLMERFTLSSMFTGLETPLLVLFSMIFWTRVFDAISESGGLSIRRSVELGLIASALLLARLEVGAFHIVVGSALILANRAISSKGILYA